MPSPFNITAVTPVVPLTSDREGKASYTVSNVSGAPIRGRANLTPVDQTLLDWLKLEGDVERDFSVNGTQQYTVEIKVPVTAAAGDYTFHLDMVGVENPDDLFSQGQPVIFKVPVAAPPPPPPPPKAKGYIVTLVGTIVGLLTALSADAILVITYILILTATIKGSVSSAATAALLIFPVVIVIALIWIGMAVGGWLALKIRKLDYPARTGWVIVGAIPLWVIIFAIIIFLIHLILGSIQLGILGLILGLLLLFIPPGLIARAIVLRWKTGKF